MTQDSADKETSPANGRSGFSTAIIVALGVFALLTGLWFGGAMSPRPGDDSAISGNDGTIPGGFVYPDPRPVDEFLLTDHDGGQFDASRFDGYWTFIYLGYTYCPDVCPVTLNELKHVDQQLSESDARQGVQYVFISVDPGRDTLDRLKVYTEYFNPTFVSATSQDQSQLEIIARSLAMIFVPVAEDQAKQDYLVDHSSSVALVGPDAKLHAVFTAPQKAAELVAGLASVRARWNNSAS